MLEHRNETDVRLARVVVVGSHGFVGNAIAARLESDGVPVERVTREDVDLLAPGAEVRLGAFLQPGNALVAAAAMAPCRNATMLRDNMTLALAIARAAAGIPLGYFMNIGSDSVYADSSEPLTESSPMAPDTLHGVMHLARELMFRSEISAPMVSLRPTLVYGEADPHNGYGPNRFRRLAASGEPIVLFGEGEERRDHILIDDVAELAVRLLYRKSVGSLNAATGVVTSFRDIAEMVVGSLGAPVPIQGSPRTGPMPHNGYRAFDTSVCRTAFPDFSFTPLSQGLKIGVRS